jgi:aminocarboxymuconate-semialdehyde decarboxylase
MNGTDETPGDDDTSPVIDTHVHALPSALLDQITDHEVDGLTAVRADGGWLVTIPGSPEPKLVRPLMVNVGRRAEWAARAGLDSQVVSPWLDAQPTGAMTDRAARDWARRLNAALCEQEPGHAVLATVAVTPAAAADLRAAVDEDGMAGLILSTNPPGVTSLADPALEDLWETAAGLEVPVVLHPPTDGPSRELPGAGEFGNTFCRLIDSTLAVTSLLLSGVLDRHPRLRLVVVHGGGFLPYQSLRLDGGHRADALSAHVIERDRPSDYLPDLFFDTVAMRADSIRFLAEVAGPGQVLLGSDYPFPLGDPDPPGTVRAAGLAPAATASVLGGTAARLFPTAIGSLHV